MSFPRVSDHPIFGETDSWLVQEAVMARYASVEALRQRDDQAFADARAKAHEMAVGG